MEELNNLYMSPGIVRVATEEERGVQDVFEMRNAHTHIFWKGKSKRHYFVDL
jgi:hypothetical protein